MPVGRLIVSIGLAAIILVLMGVPLLVMYLEIHSASLNGPFDPNAMPLVRTLPTSGNGYGQVLQILFTGIAGLATGASVEDIFHGRGSAWQWIIMIVVVIVVLLTGLLYVYVLVKAPFFAQYKTADFGPLEQYLVYQLKLVIAICLTMAGLLIGRRAATR